jgi:hypothetical protein
VRTVGWVIAAGLLAASCGSEPDSPVIEAILPDSAKTGEAVDVVGEHFFGTERTVSFGAQNAAVLLWQERRARATVPAGPMGATVVVVMVDGRRSNVVTFHVTGP